jgi:hypothetical protein
MSVELHPILSAMRRNKVGAIVIVVRTAITLTILCNSLEILQTWRPKYKRIWRHCAPCLKSRSALVDEQRTLLRG